MASYKKMYEAAMEEAKRLQGEIDLQKQLDGLCENLEDSDMKDFILTFADRCQNRAEVNLMLRIAKQLGA